MKKLGLILFLLLSIVTISLVFFGASMTAQAENDALLLFTRSDEENDLTSIHLLNADTGEERQIIEFPDWGYAGWGTDGRIWVVDSTYRLHFFDAGSGEESLLEETLFSDRCHPSLNWSPDGRYFAYFTGTDSVKLMTIINILDGTSYSMPVELYTYLHWSPDGTSMLITESGSKRLLRSTDSHDLLRGTSLLGGYSYFSPDSRYLASDDESGIVQIFEIATGVNSTLESSGRIRGWSPGSRNLLIGNEVEGGERLSYYDTQTGVLTPLDLSYPVRFAAWAEDEMSLFLFSNFVDARPQKVLAYDLVSGEVETVFETTGWIDAVYIEGDWVVIPYTSTAPSQLYATTTELFFGNGETRIQEQISRGHTFWYNLSSSPDGRWFSVASALNIYGFDTRNASLTPIGEGSYSSVAYWSPDSAYLAFKNKTGYLSVWNAESNQLLTLPEPISFPGILGWQYGSVQDSSTHCNAG